ncbi:MAG: dual specificity protein phosphatase family protein [Candidatus Wallbacteria bacterium]|nr:dual specificity protein phosphatase family protein [Candidatus Wallbacteria bacterium]
MTDARSNSLRFGWVLPRKLAGCRRPDGEPDYQLLKQEGVGTLVSLLEWGGVPSFAPLYGFQHIHIPINDGCPPTAGQLERFVDLVRSNGSTCVHCLAGIGRTGCMLTGYLIRACAYDPFEAIRHVESLRVYAFQTDEQEDWLYGLTPRLLPGED